MSKPFVSFIVMSYKAEKFIKEAIDGALAQTYDNLEIIFSDDASPDRTFEIIEENVKNYTGKHKGKISVYRNEKNLGIGAHLNKLWWEIAKGDWIVVSAGDDVSLPIRVEKLMEFAADDVGLIHHANLVVDENTIPNGYVDTYGRITDILENESIENIIKKKVWVRGATMCINTKMLRTFEPFLPSIVNEDVVLAYRSKHYGKIIHINEKLLKYREHSASISYSHNTDDYKNYKLMVGRESKNRIALYNQILIDNKILKLSNELLKVLNNNFKKDLINSFLYSDTSFHFRFLFDKHFYFYSLKFIILKPYLSLKKGKKSKRLNDNNHRL